ncbi:hypothetical protein Tco_1016123 [Tanacetum coccineum]|uniref:Uncharacterized protein n=1 Tax=Tanacetum coccineum TaxID=301880 RepID=A0ABQ5FNX7_9ASTR
MSTLANQRALFWGMWCSEGLVGGAREEGVSHKKEQQYWGSAEPQAHQAATDQVLEYKCRGSRRGENEAVVERRPPSTSLDDQASWRRAWRVEAIVRGAKVTRETTSSNKHEEPIDKQSTRVLRPSEYFNERDVTEFLENITATKDEATVKRRNELKDVQFVAHKRIILKFFPVDIREGECCVADSSEQEGTRTTKGSGLSSETLNAWNLLKQILRAQTEASKAETSQKEDVGRSGKKQTARAEQTSSHFVDIESCRKDMEIAKSNKLRRSHVPIRKGSYGTSMAGVFVVYWERVRSIIQ